MTGTELALDDVERIALDGVRVDLGDGARGRVAAARAVVDDTAGTNMSTYGLNTGVGRFVDTRIPDGLTSELQRRVLRSHAAGVGQPYPDEVVRAAQLLRINTLALGYSGVRVDLVERMLEILNAGIIPYVPGRGSVGASGDLAPLSHLCLPVIGEGRAFVDGELMSSADALARYDIAPLELASKEGLSLINGTQFMTALGVLALLDAEYLCDIADLTGAISLEALK
ncbi:MAG: aromatic amino acid lyase, partial [Thermoleophilia bacterium]|nr:aromatic amino acid lyase [Thermoleophilia bacterium]